MKTNAPKPGNVKSRRDAYPRSTIRQPFPGDSAITGLRSSSTISGTSSASRETRSSISRRASVIGRSVSAESFEQLESSDAVDEIVRIAIGQRRHPESDVAKHFNIDSTQAERDQRSKERIVGDANHGFDTARNHRLNHPHLRPRHD